MRTSVPCLVLLLASLVPDVVAAQGKPKPKPQPQSHCVTGERNYLSCSLGKKVLSVCTQGSGEEMTVQYRFGALGKVEKKAPDPALPVAQAVTGGRVMFSGGGGLWLRFKSGDVTYVVFSGIGRGWESEGVAVEKDGKEIARLQCKSAPFSDSGGDEILDFTDDGGMPEFDFNP